MMKKKRGTGFIHHTHTLTLSHTHTHTRLKSHFYNIPLAVFFFIISHKPSLFLSAHFLNMLKRSNYIT